MGGRGQGPKAKPDKASRAGTQAHRQHGPQLLSTGVAVALQEAARLCSPCFVQGQGRTQTLFSRLPSTLCALHPHSPRGSRVIAVPWHRRFTVRGQLKVQERGTCCAKPWGARVPAGDSPPTSSRSAGQPVPHVAHSGPEPGLLGQIWEGGLYATPHLGRGQGDSTWAMRPETHPCWARGSGVTSKCFTTSHLPSANVSLF